MNTNRANQLLVELQAELERMELEAIAISEDTAIALLPQLNLQSQVIERLAEIHGSITAIADRRISNERISQLYPINCIRSTST